MLYNPGSDEQKFLEASMAYVAGKPILTDQEYDQLKLRLKVCVSVKYLYCNEYDQFCWGSNSSKVKLVSD
jgi:hypothetical protein